MKQQKQTKTKDLLLNQRLLLLGEVRPLAEREIYISEKPNHILYIRKGAKVFKYNTHKKEIMVGEEHRPKIEEYFISYINTYGGITKFSPTTYKSDEDPIRRVLPKRYHQSRPSERSDY